MSRSRRQGRVPFKWKCLLDSILFQNFSYTGTCVYAKGNTHSRTHKHSERQGWWLKAKSAKEIFLLSLPRNVRTNKTKQRHTSSSDARFVQFVMNVMICCKHCVSRELSLKCHWVQKKETHRRQVEEEQLHGEGPCKSRQICQGIQSKLSRLPTTAN